MAAAGRLGQLGSKRVPIVETSVEQPLLEDEVKIRRQKCGRIKQLRKT